MLFSFPKSVLDQLNRASSGLLFNNASPGVTGSPVEALRPSDIPGPRAEDRKPPILEPRLDYEGYRQTLRNARDAAEREPYRLLRPQAPSGYSRPGVEGLAGAFAILGNLLDRRGQAGSQGYAAFRQGVAQRQTTDYQNQVQAYEDAMRSSMLESGQRVREWERELKQLDKLEAGDAVRAKEAKDEAFRQDQITELYRRLSSRPPEDWERLVPLIEDPEVARAVQLKLFDHYDEEQRRKESKPPRAPLHSNAEKLLQLVPTELRDLVGSAAGLFPDEYQTRVVLDMVRLGFDPQGELVGGNQDAAKQLISMIDATTQRSHNREVLRRLADLRRWVSEGLYQESRDWESPELP